MNYFAKRTAFAIANRKRWLVLALFPPLVFLLVSMVKVDRYVIMQEVTFDAGRTLAPAEIHAQLSAAPFLEPGGNLYPILDANSERSVAFRVNPPSSIQVVYDGTDAVNGRELVRHYIGRLRKNLAALEGTAMEEATSTVSTIEVRQMRSLWRNDRLIPLIQYIFVSIVTVIIVLVVLEFGDASLKSERMSAQYLKVPMLGSLPDMDNFIKVLRKDIS